MKGVMNKNEVIEYLVTKVHDADEPLFLLRGQDVCAPHAVTKWIQVAESSGVSKEKIEGAARVATDMVIYKGKKKFPD